MLSFRLSQIRFPVGVTLSDGAAGRVQAVIFHQGVERY